MGMPQFGDTHALLQKVDYKINQKRKRCVFVIGSGLTADTIPGSEQMLKNMRSHLGDSKTRRHFDLSISTTIASERYQQAAIFLQQYRGQDFLNDVVRRCVLKAYSRRITARARWNEDAL